MQASLDSDSQQSERAFYGVEDQLPWGLAWALGLQHVLGMFVGIVTPPLIVASVLGISLEDKAFLVSMSLLTSGLTTLVQTYRIGPLGSGLLSVTGPSFVFVPLAIAAGKEGGLALVFGMALSCCWIPAAVALSLRWVHRFFPPVVTGTAIALIGFSLIGVGFSQLSGGVGCPDAGHPRHFLLGAVVMAVIVATQRYPRYASISLAFGLLGGWLLAFMLGRVDPAPLSQAAWVHWPGMTRYGLAFSWGHLASWAVAYLLVALECIGDLTATCVVSRQPTSGEKFEARLRGGLLSDSFGCLLTSLLNAFPKTTFAQNNGIIALTGVASRQAGLCVGLILILLGLFPKFACLISLMPAPVLGGATIVLFSTVAVTGLHSALGPGWDSRRHLIVAISLGLGLGLSQSGPNLAGLHQFLDSDLFAPAVRDGLKVLFESGLALGTLVALVLHLVLPERKSAEEQQPGESPH